MSLTCLDASKKDGQEILQSRIIRTVWSESSRDTLWVANDPKLLQADSENTDQPAGMRRLIYVFAGRIIMQSCKKCCTPAQSDKFAEARQNDQCRIYGR